MPISNTSQYDPPKRPSLASRHAPRLTITSSLSITSPDSQHLPLCEPSFPIYASPIKTDDFHDTHSAAPLSIRRLAPPWNLPQDGEVFPPVQRCQPLRLGRRRPPLR